MARSSSGRYTDIDLSLIAGERVEASLHAPVPPDKPYFNFPGVATTSDVNCAAVNALAEKLAAFDADEKGDDGFFRGTCIFDGFERLKNALGTPIAPPGQPVDDSDDFRDFRSLPQPPATLGDTFQAVAEDFVPLEIRPGTIYVDKHASAGLPHRYKGAEKLAAIQASYFRAREILDRVARRDTAGLARQHGWVYVNSPGHRDQPDPPDKVRTVQNFAGAYVQADIRLPDDFVGGSDWRRCRRRVINVAPMSGIFLTQLATSWKSSTDSVAGFTTVTRSPGQLMMKLATSPAFDEFDVSNHDQTIPFDSFMRAIDVVQHRLGDIWGALVLLTLRQPTLHRPDFPGQKGWYLSGNPMDFTTFRNRPTNMSGIRMTTQFAQLAGITYLVWALEEAGEIKRGSATDRRRLYTGENPHWKFCNAGDNLIIGGPSMKHISDLVGQIKFVEMGRANSFLGWLPYRDEHGARFVPSPVSYIYNCVMPSRSFGDPRRGDPVQGSAERQSYYSTCPTFKDLSPHLLAYCREGLGFEEYGLRASGEAPTEDANLRFDIIRLIEDNIDKIHYLVPRELIPADIGDRYFSTLGEDYGKMLIEAVREQATTRAAHWASLYQHLRAA